jgi:transcriptional regulator of acetoin/glycerol metabolism
MQPTESKRAPFARLLDESARTLEELRQDSWLFPGDLRDGQDLEDAGESRGTLGRPMAKTDETHEDSLRRPDLAAVRKPGIVVVFAAGRPAGRVIEVGRTGAELGRGLPEGFFEDDDRVSRHHAKISRKGDEFVVEDHDSRNGTFVNGRKLEAATTCTTGSLVRIGRSLLWLVDDVSPFSANASYALLDGPVVGGHLRNSRMDIALAARAGDTLFIRGETGSGKELAARAFHEARHGKGGAPFVPVNCAAIPEGLAERLLFGARKGAFSGAVADADGYVQAADGGTLFLDEIGDLDLQVQAKLLRVLESREVLPLGSSTPKRVTFSVCAASHKSLRDEVQAGRFREDLYFRIGRPEVLIPRLKERVDEIPIHVMRELQAVDTELTPSAAFIEACALREWPGNVRELLREIRSAAHRAVEESVMIVDDRHLAREAGVAFSRTTSETKSEETSETPRIPPTDDMIEKALIENNGNVRGTARHLGMHRNQLRRWLEKRGRTGKEVNGHGNGNNGSSISTVPPSSDGPGSGRDEPS